MIAIPTSRSQRGDTLIEVTLALVILGMVLTGSLVVAVKASQTGQTARERTRLSNEAQAQVESVRAFRDAHSWSEFLNGDTASTFKGVLSGLSTGGLGCKVASPCLHMGLGAVQYLPVGGGMKGSVPTSYIEVAVAPGPGAIPQYVDVTVSYGFGSPGGGPDSLGHIKTQFTNLQYAAPTPVIAPPLYSPCIAVSPTAQFVYNFMTLAELTNPIEVLLNANNLEYPYNTPAPLPTRTYNGIGITLPPGRYQIVVMSYEDHVNTPGSRLSTDTRLATDPATDFEGANENYESYRLLITDGNGTHTTGYTTDMAQNANIGIWNSTLNGMGGTITQIVAEHRGLRDTFINGQIAGEGVSPVCVGFTKI